MQPDDPVVTALREWFSVFVRNSMRYFLLNSKEIGVSMPQFGALMRIHKGIGGVSDLGDDLGVTSAAASQMLERMVQLELIQRSEDPHDRRVKQITLTDKGREVLEKGVHARQAWIDDLAASLSNGEKEQVIGALRILIDKVKILEEHPELER